MCSHCPNAQPVDVDPRPDTVIAAPIASAVDRTFRVLVVDDNLAIHADLRKVLASAVKTDFTAMETQLFGLESATATPRLQFEITDAMQGGDGIEAVRRACEEGRPFAVAFIDMRMPPGKDGLETIVAIMRLDPNVQIVNCSAYSDYSWEEMTTAIGETDRVVILRKPFDPAEALQLTHTLTKKWDLQCALQRHITDLETMVAERTRELAEKNQMFELILEHATDLIAVVDADGRRIYNSPSYQSVLGLDPDELRQSHALAQLHPDDVAAVSASIERTRCSGRGETLVYRMRHRDGSWRVLESSAGAVRGADGQVACFVIVARDITRQHEHEVKERLNQKLESIGRLAAGIAHEINTPTQYITDNTRFLADAFRSLLQLVEHDRASVKATADAVPVSVGACGGSAVADLDYLKKEVPQAIQQNLEGLARVSRIVRSLKEFSHPETVESAPADLNRAIETAISVTRHEWKYVADVETDLDPEMPPVPCILDEFNQVMLNLLVNAAQTIADALKARQERRGKITVRTRREDHVAVVEVTDTGMGIRPELRQRVFEPFFTTKRRGQGTGQGLALVHAVVVKHHHGTVAFRTEVGCGTTFEVRLPLGSAPAGEPAHGG